MDKTDSILGLLKQVGETKGFSLDDAFAGFPAAGLTHKVVYDYSTGAYDQVWEHPRIAGMNARTKHPLGHHFCTLYRLNPAYRQHEGGEFYPAFKLIVGRIGATTVYRID